MPLFLLAAWPAHACSPVLSTHTDAEIVQLAREAIGEADVIVDAVVTEPMAPDIGRGVVRSAVLTVTRVWKGKAEPVILLLDLGSCNVNVLKKGESVRLLMTRMRDYVFTADQGQNGWFFHIESESIKYRKAIDSLIAQPVASPVVSDGGPQPGNAPNLTLPILIGIGAGLLTFLGLIFASRVWRLRRKAG